MLKLESNNDNIDEYINNVNNIEVQNKLNLNITTPVSDINNNTNTNGNSSYPRKIRDIVEVQALIEVENQNKIHSSVNNKKLQNNTISKSPILKSSSLTFSPKSNSLPQIIPITPVSVSKEHVKKRRK